MCCLEERLKLYDQNFCERISSECISKFNSLGKNGRPVNNEWVIVACILKAERNNQNATLKVVSLGTGSKCIGMSKLPSKGDRLHDSHAEVIARRAFKLYLIEQLKLHLENKESIFIFNKEGFVIKECISFHFFCNHVPCGDASIFPKLSESHLANIGSLVVTDVFNENRTKKLKIDRNVCVYDIHRTGAKCVSNEPLDSKEEGLDYHTVGALRTKPGRGDPTLSHCCSDKIFKWTVLGVQGALLMLFLKRPVYLETIIIGSDNFSRDALERALCSRFEDQLIQINFESPFEVRTPAIMQSRNTFPLTKPAQGEVSEKTLKPSPASIVWSDTITHKFRTEVSVEGKKLGTSKKNENSSKSRVSICRIELMKKTIELINIIKDKFKKDDICFDQFQYLDFVTSGVSYRELKEASKCYNKMRNDLHEIVLRNWTPKPNYIKKFVIDD